MNARLLTVGAAGALFGIGLALSGMTDPARVIGFLDVAGAWDPSLLFVMGGAVTTFGAGWFLWRWKRGRRGWFGTTLPERDCAPIDAPLIIGSAIFGVGWGMVGFCPGPALANLAALRAEAFVFVPAMAVGMLLVRAVFEVDRD
jgi:uncharacterized protein